MADDDKTTATGPAGNAAPDDAAGAARVRVPADQRWRMIAEAAYYRARARNFKGGNPGEDWLAAEAEIDRKLADGTGTGSQAGASQDEQAAYRRLREEVEKRLAAIKGTVDAKAIQDAFERATVHVRRVGGHAAVTVNRAADRLRRDMSRAAGTLGPRWEEFSGRAAGVFAVWRERGAGFLQRAAEAVSEWRERTGRGSDPAILRAGASVEPGGYRCTRCGTLVQVESSGPLSACPSCRHTQFRRAPE